MFTNNVHAMHDKHVRMYALASDREDTFYVYNKHVFHWKLFETTSHSCLQLQQSLQA